jgi:uncharacterized RDD family membrane protein YckC
VTSPNEPGYPGEKVSGEYGNMPPAPEQYGAPAGYGPPQGMPELAGWFTRVLGALLEYFLPSVVLTAVFQSAMGREGNLPANALFLVYVLFLKWQEGTTGQSWGKKIVGIRVLRERDGQVIGFGLAVARYLLHILDTLACFVGWLWPLWDQKKQTFADKIVSTVVIKG